MSYKNTELFKMLRAVLKEPIIVMIEGDWRSGKTDFALLVAWLAKKWGLISAIGSNIFTYNNPEVDFIEETGKLKRWMYKTHEEKIFILDEALKTIYVRKAMSRLTVKIITDILPEISKGHVRLFILTQINKLDKDVLHPAFHRATWKKESKKVVHCWSKHYPYRRFVDLPRSPIRFDKDIPAKFIDKDLSKVADTSNLPIILRVAELYAQNIPLAKIEGITGVHRQQVKRHIQKALKWFSDNYEESKRSKTLEKGIPPEQG